MTKLHRFVAAALLAMIVPALATPHATAAGPDDLHRQLASARLPLNIRDGRFSGSGWEAILAAAGQSEFIAIGEDHLTREVPAFVGALCDALGPRLAAMAVEAGPDAAHFAAANLRYPDHDARMAALIGRYPDSVAFLNMATENDLISRCARSSGNDFQLWGLDQEFIGASGRLMDEALARPIGAAARASLVRLRAEEAADAKAAEQTGDLARLFVYAANDTELAASYRLIDQSGDDTARQLFGSLLATHRIYKENLEHSPVSKLDRALLLKKNLARHLAADLPAGSRKILFKFGDWHLYRGYNPLDERDLGNAIAEYADMHGGPSLHIAILGAKGVHAHYGGYAKPLLLTPFLISDDPDYRWMKAALDEAEPAGWTLFDLRRMRVPAPNHLPYDWQRLVDGYDLLILIPDITPATLVHR